MTRQATRYAVSMAKTGWLTEDEQQAWRAYRRMVLLVDAEIARELTGDSGLSMPDYQVLSALSEAADRRQRLSELAVSMQWSPSRLSHHVSRMEQRALVTRAGCDSDARGAYVVLSDQGLDAIKQAAPEHVESVRRHLINLLTPEQLAALAQIAETVIGHFGEKCPSAAAKRAARPPTPASRKSADRTAARTPRRNAPE